MARASSIFGLFRRISARAKAVVSQSHISVLKGERTGRYSLNARMKRGSWGLLAGTEDTTLMGDEKPGPVRFSFNPQLRVEFRGATVPSDAGLLLLCQG